VIGPKLRIMEHSRERHAAFDGRPSGATIGPRRRCWRMVIANAGEIAHSGACYVGVSRKVIVSING
jgi:hypothetical protein